MRMIKFLNLAIITSLLSFPVASQAAESGLFFSSRAGVYPAGKSWTSRVMLYSDTKVNSAEGLVTFDPKKIQVEKIEIKDSLFKLWVTEPKVDNAAGRINFAGGIPGGSYNGQAGKIFDIVFKPTAGGRIDLKFSTSSSRVLTADGDGKNILTDVGDGVPTFGNIAGIRAAENLTKKMTGRILLQVERNGEAWYIYPNDKRRYFMGRPADAFNLMRRLGLGAKNSFIKAYQGKTYPTHVSGKILIDVEDSGKAYYINSKDRKGHYLGRPDDAFRIMREQGLGISNDNINKIPDWAI